MLSLPRGSSALPHGPSTGARDAPRANGRPLVGRHIALTWSVEQGQILTSALEAAGARITPLFAGAVAPVADTSALDAALLRLDHYDRVVLTGLAGVEAFAQRLAALDIGPEACRRVYIAMLFPVTARAREFAALPPQLVPAAVLADDIEAGLRDIAGKRVLLLSAERAPDALTASLRWRGAEVDEVNVYRMIAHPVDAQALEHILVRSRVDVVMCTSGDMAEGLLEGLLRMGRDPAEALRTIPLVALDAATAAILRRAGLEPAVAAATTATGDGAALPLEALVNVIVSATSAAVPANTDGRMKINDEGVFFG